ncbi:MAG: hypothetical protein ACP5DX_18430, partial [Paracoccaceae bacterium]
YKTGSTSIQRSLASNADQLRARGVFYPYRPGASYIQRWQHVPLAAAVPGRNLRWLTRKKLKTLDCAYSEFFGDLARKDFDVLVVSSEGFCDPDMTPEKIAWVKEKFADFDVTVVAYIRRQDAYFLSTYQEMIKSGGTGPFDFSAYGKARRLYFGQRLAPWRQVFGAENVIVRPFDAKLWPKGELFFDFLQVIGTQRRNLAPAAPENEGLDYRAVELLRQLNLQRQGTSGGPDLAGHRKLAEHLDRMCAAGAGKKKMALSSEQANALRNHFRADNEAALEGSGISADDFFPPVPPGREARLVPERLDPELLLQLIWELIPQSLR